MPAAASFPFIALLAAVPAQAPTGPGNLDFEEDLGTAASGWFAPPAVAESYDAKLVAENAKSGKRCALIASRGNPKPEHFGNLMQSFDATPYRGRRVRFRAAVRIEPQAPRGQARLWLRVDRQGGQPGFFDNLGNRPVTAREWKVYEIVGEVAEDAVAVNVGCMLIGTGKAWFDSASFEVLGQAGEGNEPPR